jgi:hypothetical protein
MKARDSRKGHERVKVTFGSARQLPSASSIVLSCRRALEERKQSHSAVSKGFVNAESAQLGDRKGG